MFTSFSEIFISEKDDAENIDLLVINWSGLVKPALAVLRMTACFFGCLRVPIDKLIKMKILTISLIFSNYFIGWRFHFLKLSFLAFLLAIFKKWAQLRVCWLFAHFLFNSLFNETLPNIGPISGSPRKRREETKRPIVEKP